MDMSEHWLPVVGFEGRYEVSDLGRVRSVLRAAVLKAATTKSGHKFVMLGRRNGRLVHHLVLQAFVGPCPPGCECCHWDGDAANNSPSNLRWGTRKENVADTARHGRLPMGERHVRALLRDVDIPEIRRRVTTERSETVAADYGVSVSTIRNIKNGYNWKSIP